jgi:hypothetical protein
MAPNERARKNHDELFPGHVSTLAVTDPELIESFVGSRSKRLCIVTSTSSCSQRVTRRSVPGVQRALRTQEPQFELQ